MRSPAVLALFLLTACGGGDSAPPPPPVVVTPAPTPAPAPAPTEDPNPLPVPVGPVITLNNAVAVFGDSVPFIVGEELIPQVTNPVHNHAQGSYTSTDTLRDWRLYPEHQRTLILWTGHNNFPDEATLLSDIDMMVQGNGHDRFIVVGLISANVPAEWTGAPNRVVKDRINAELARRYPGHFLDAQALLLQWGNPNNAQDRIDVANGAIPGTLRDPGNSFHLRRESGARVMVNALKEMMQARGW